MGASENNRPTIGEQYVKYSNTGYYQPLIRDDLKADNIDGMAAFSSRGPANANTPDNQDNRIKPDVVAPGTMVLSTRTQAPANVSYRFDNMESGTGQWTTTGPWARVSSDSHSATTSWHDSPGGNYTAGVTTEMRWAPIDLSAACTDRMLQFWFKIDVKQGDVFVIQLSDPAIPGSPRRFPYIGTMANWEPLRVRLGDYSCSSNLTVSFRIEADPDANTGDGAWVDDVRIYKGAFGQGIPSNYGLTPVGSTVDQNYMFNSGTSMATPLTAGAAALVRQYYMEYEGRLFVSAALLRATLINGAVDMSPGQYPGITEVAQLPNNVEGFGRIDVKNSILPPLPASLSHVDELSGIKQGETTDYTYTVTDPLVPIVATMVYHDPAGETLVNQLDLRIISPTGSTSFPNGLTAADSRNNVEQIRIPTPSAGSYTIRIDAPRVMTSAQPYALVVTGGGELIERGPVDVMLALDISGSMQSPACSSCEAKIDVLKQAVEIFVQVWTAVTVPSDRIGANYFASTISKFQVGTDVLVPVLPNAPGLITDVRSRVAGGLTAMGGSLQTAINALTDATRPRNIVLFTDGMQNLNPMVNDVTFEIENVPKKASSAVNPTSPPTDLNANLGIKVSTIGVGSTPQFAGLLSDIAAQTGGLTKLTTTPDEELRRFFIEELVDVLRGFSPQLLAYRHGSMAGISATESFEVNNTARQVILKLSWSPSDTLTFRVEKDGTDVTALGQIIDGDFYRIFSIDVPARGPGELITGGGDWHMHISGQAATSYEASAIVDEESLEYNFSVGAAHYVAGKSLELKARLSLGDQPLPTAQITAHVLAPTIGLGTLLSDTTSLVIPPGIRFESQASPAQRKYQLKQLDDGFHAALQPVVHTIMFESDHDGDYSATFPETKVTGLYKVIFQIDANHTEAGSFSRTESRSALVSFGNADPSSSEWWLSPAVNGGRQRLFILPVDRFGNLLGPDYGHVIDVEINGDPFEIELVDALNGSYSFIVPRELGTESRIVVRVMNELLFDDVLGELHQRR